MPSKRPPAPRPAPWLWMHKEIQHYSQSFRDFAEDCEAKESAHDGPVQGTLSATTLEPSVASSYASTPESSSGCRTAGTSKPPITPAAQQIPLTPAKPVLTIMAQQANQGLPRQSEQSSPQSTTANGLTHESHGTGDMASLLEDSLELPVLPAPPCATADDALAFVSNIPFNHETVCAALQNSCSVKSLSEYFGVYVPEFVKSRINEKICGKAAPIFYAIEYAIRHDTMQPIRLLLDYGANASEYMTTIGQPCGLPALAFAVIRAGQQLKSSLPILQLLLSVGARPSFNPVAIAQNAGGVTHWSNICHEYTHLSHAYFLQRAQKCEASLGGTKKQLADIHGVLDLLTIDHFVIGQEYALKLVKDSIFAHLATNSQYPLVMAFAGPSGHGKTEMASQMGRLLSLEITIVDCAHMKHDTDLFGSRNGYKRSEEGSQLNNFLAEHDGERAVVFLDEFDKTPQEIRHSLLLICDSGAYHDRRTNKIIDCSKILWVLATNLGDHEIREFCQKKLESNSTDANADMPVAPLQQKVLDIFRDHFGAPFTGRVDIIVPFLPFTETEQCVMTHIFLLRLAEELRLPINCHPAVKRYIGRSYLDLGDGVDLVKHIATTYYTAELGARSLKRGIEELKRKFVMVYCEANPTEITEELNTQPLKTFHALVRRKMNGKSDIVVVYKGLSPVNDKSPASRVTKITDDREHSNDSLSSDTSSSVDNDDDRFLRDKPQSQGRYT